MDLPLKLGILEPSKSEWRHPAVLVSNTDGTIRFCIDFLNLNSVFKLTSDLIEHLGSCKYLTTINLSKGY